jgi:hypothetical protein
VKKRLHRILFVSLVASLGLAAGYEYATHVGRGWLRGEAFFQGRPTSAWRDELERWNIKVILVKDRCGPYEYNLFERPATVRECVQKRCWPFPGFMVQDYNGPELLHRDPTATPVLCELCDDPSPKVRAFARIGLGLDPDLPRESE